MRKLLAVIITLSMIMGTCLSMASCTPEPEPEDSSSQITETTESTETSLEKETTVTISTEALTETQTETSSGEAESLETSEEGSASSDATGSSETTETTESSEITETTESAEQISPETTEIYGNGATVEKVGAEWEPDFYAGINCSIDKSAAVEISAFELLGKMFYSSGDYALKEGGVYRVTDTIVLSSDKKYHGNGAVIIAEGGIVIKDKVDVIIENMIISGSVSVENSSEIVFHKVNVISNDTAVSVNDASSDITFKSCRIISGAKAIASKADNVVVYRSYVSANEGITLLGDNITVQDCKVFATGCAITICGKNCIVRENTVEVASSGTGITVTGGSVNTLVALNDISNVQRSIVASGAFNCSVILNRAVTIIGESNTNLYVSKQQERYLCYFFSA